MKDKATKETLIQSSEPAGDIPPNPKRKMWTWILALALLAGVIMTYSNHFSNGFHFDDTHTISQNPAIRSLSNIPDFFTDVRTFGSMPNNLGYEPIVTTSTAIDYYFSVKDPLKLNKEKKWEEGFVPFYYHWPMFIIYLLQGILMFFMILKLFNISYKQEWNLWLVFFTVGWYMLHPGQAETINYLCQRAESFSTFFMILGLVMFIFSKFCRRYWLYLIPPVLGVMSKETAAMFPALLFIYVMFFERKMSIADFFRRSQWKNTRALIVTVLPAFVLLFAAIMGNQLLLYVQTSSSGTFNASYGKDYHFDYLMTQPYILFTYFLQFFIPMGLSSDPDLAVFESAADIRMWIGFVFLAGLLYVTVIASRTEKGRPIAFGLLWFLIASIPTSFIFALSQVANSHRLFFPYVGLVIAVSWTVYLFIRKIKPVFLSSSFAKALVVIAVLLLSAYAYGTYQRNKVWLNDDTLWEDIVKTSPGNARALMNYGLSKMGKGEFFEAEYYYRKSLNIWPNWTYTHINMGILKGAMGATAEAEQWFLSAIRVAGNNQEPYYYYARFLYQQKRYDQAIANLKTAVQIFSNDIKSRNLMMAIYAEQEQWDLLAAVAQETLQIVPGEKNALQYLEMSKNRKGSLQTLEEQTRSNPSPEGYLSLSLEYYNRGDYKKCIEACEEALKINPSYAEAYNNICSAYNAMKMWDEGIKACEKALELMPEFERARNNLNYAKTEKAKVSVQ